MSGSELPAQYSAGNNIVLIPGIRSGEQATTLKVFQARARTVFQPPASGIFPKKAARESLLTARHPQASPAFLSMTKIQ
jgi:hypothetical protein